jgi:hypothetical protein
MAHLSDSYQPSHDGLSDRRGLVFWHFSCGFARVLVLERKIETTDNTDYTDYTDYERVMNFMTPIIWVSLRLDRSGSSYPCNPLQSVKSVVKNAAATFFIFIFLS